VSETRIPRKASVNIKAKFVLVLLDKFVVLLGSCDVVEGSCDVLQGFCDVLQPSETKNTICCCDNNAFVFFVYIREMSKPCAQGRIKGGSNGVNCPEPSIPRGHP